MRFKKDEDTLFQGNEGGQAGSILPAASAYFVFGCNDRLKMGLSVNSPYGGNYNYGKSWTGRYFTQRVFLATLAANPSIAYRITPKLSFGAGFTVEYGYLQQALALNPAVFGQLPVINPDGRLKLLMDSFAYGYNFGLMYQLTPCTRLGVTYRSRLKHDFEGRAEVTGPNKAISLGIDTNLTFADYVLASVYHKVNSRFALLANLGWDNWSVFDRTVLTSDQDGQLVLPRNWKDTWHAAIGVEYQLCCPLLLQAGFSYDSSPTDAEDRTPDLPMDHQFHFATGLIYQSNRCERFSLGLEYVYGGPGKIDKVGPGGQLHLLKGEYPHANLVILNFSYNRKM